MTGGMIIREISASAAANLVANLGELRGSESLDLGAVIAHSGEHQTLGSIVITSDLNGKNMITLPRAAQGLWEGAIWD